MEKSRENHDVASFARFNPFDLKFICFLRLEKKERRYRARIELTEDGSGFAWKDRDHDRSREKQKGNAGEKRGKKSKPRLPPPKASDESPSGVAWKRPSPIIYFFYLCRFLTRHLALSPRSLPLLFDNKRCASIELGNECRSPLFDYRALRSDQVNDLQSYLSFSSLNDRVLKYRFQR